MPLPLPQHPNDKLIFPSAQTFSKLFYLSAQTVNIEHTCSFICISWWAGVVFDKAYVFDGRVKVFWSKLTVINAAIRAQPCRALDTFEPRPLNATVLGRHTAIAPGYLKSTRNILSRASILSHITYRPFANHCKLLNATGNSKNCRGIHIPLEEGAGNVSARGSQLITPLGPNRIFLFPLTHQ